MQKGFLVPPKNSKAFATAIIELIQNPQLREKMGLYNSKLCKENYDWNKIVDQIENMYCEAIAIHKTLK